MNPERDQLEISVTEADGFRLLRLTGEFDLTGVDSFERHLDPEAAATAVVDLGALTFLDSSGLRALILTDLGFRERGGRLVVLRPQGQVAKLLELTGLADRLEIAEEIPPGLGAGNPNLSTEPAARCE